MLAPALLWSRVTAWISLVRFFQCMAQGCRRWARDVDPRSLSAVPDLVRAGSHGPSVPVRAAPRPAGLHSRTRGQASTCLSGAATTLRISTWIGTSGRCSRGPGVGCRRAGRTGSDRAQPATSRGRYSEGDACRTGRRGSLPLGGRSPQELRLGRFQHVVSQILACPDHSDRPSPQTFRRQQP